jgi:hypothetical protein
MRGCGARVRARSALAIHFHGDEYVQTTHRTTIEVRSASLRPPQIRDAVGDEAVFACARVMIHA